LIGVAEDASVLVDGGSAARDTAMCLRSVRLGSLESVSLVLPADGARQHVSLQAQISSQPTEKSHRQQM